MTSKNSKAPLLYYVKLCASFQSPWWIQTGVTVRKRSIRVKLFDFCPMWPWNSTDDIKKKNRAPPLCCFKRCASFQSHRWIQTGVTVWKRSIRIKINDFFCSMWPRNLTDDLKKQKGTSSVLLQALCIISKPSVNSNWSYSLETSNLGQNQCFF